MKCENYCFPSVECTIVNTNPRCGPCPPDYTGDGRYCVKIKCQDRPCFKSEFNLENTSHHLRCFIFHQQFHYIDVECQDIPSGYVCGKCPSGFTGDGRTCRRIDSCKDQLCYPGDLYSTFIIIILWKWQTVLWRRLIFFMNTEKRGRFREV